MRIRNKMVNPQEKTHRNVCLHYQHPLSLSLSSISIRISNESKCQVNSQQVGRGVHPIHLLSEKKTSLSGSGFHTYRKPGAAHKTGECEDEWKKEKIRTSLPQEIIIKKRSFAHKSDLCAYSCLHWHHS
jgi:hypothetical protein